MESIKTLDELIAVLIEAKNSVGGNCVVDFWDVNASLDYDEEEAINVKDVTLLVKKSLKSNVESSKVIVKLG